MCTGDSLRFFFMAVYKPHALLCIIPWLLMFLFVRHEKLHTEFFLNTLFRMCLDQQVQSAKNSHFTDCKSISQVFYDEPLSLPQMKAQAGKKIKTKLLTVIDINITTHFPHIRKYFSSLLMGTHQFSVG